MYLLFFLNLFFFFFAATGIVIYVLQQIIHNLVRSVVNRSTNEKDMHNTLVFDRIFRPTAGLKCCAEWQNPVDLSQATV